MLKQFNSIWKNATFNKFQIVIRRFATFESAVVVNQLSLLNQTCTNFPKSKPFILSRSVVPLNLCEKRSTAVRRCISSTVNRETNLKRSENVSSKYKQMEANLKWRGNPVIATLDTPQFKSILRKNILDLVAIFQKYNYEIRIAGGAVR